MHFTILCVLIRVLACILPQSLKDSCETRLPLNLVNQRFVAIHSVFLLFYCPFFRGGHKPHFHDEVRRNAVLVAEKVEQ